MLNMLFKPTPTMLNDGRSAHILFTIVALLAAVTMFLCATGSGNPTTAEPLPDFVNMAANVLAVFIGIFILIPKTRAIASIAGSLNMLASMLTNYLVDGYAYFLQVLAFDLTALGLSLVVLWHYRKDLKRHDSPSFE
jgi:hypothetical protein